MYIFSGSLTFLLMRIVLSVERLFIGVLLTLTCVAQVLAQAPTATRTASTPIADTLVVQARVTEGRVQLNWYPNQPSTWKAHLTTGYRVERTQLDSNGRAVGAPVVLAERILPKDSLWFRQHKADVNGLMRPVGALLYDTTYNFADDAELDETAVKWNFLSSAASDFPEVAAAVGMGYVDATAVPTTHYRYTVSSPQGRMATAVDLQTYEGAFNREPSAYQDRFEFPDGQSLTDMYLSVNPQTVDAVRGIGRAYGDSIVLRWGPTTPELWRISIDSGYFVYRSMGRGDLVLIDSVMPWPEDRITAQALGQDSMALLAAGLLYGEGNGPGPGETSIYEQASIAENNHGFALYAAERSALAADVLGLRYVDRNLAADSAYTYIVTTSRVGLGFNAAFIPVLNTADVDDAPRGLSATGLDGIVRLTWDKYGNESQFSAYDIERVSESGQLLQLTPKPLVFIEDQRVPITEYTYLDTTAVNGQTYTYRLRGYNSFAETSAPTEVLAKAVDLTPPPAPAITGAEYDEDDFSIAVNWVPYADAAPDLAGYRVMLAESSEGSYDAVSPVLPPGTASYRHALDPDDWDRGYFFRVEALDNSGNVAPSPTEQAIVPDLVAPLPPTELTGFIDTNSMVTVAWEHSPSRDVQGYWLYWGNDPEDEMAPVNAELLTTNTLTYYLEEESLLDKIYFVVRAQDDSYNRGETSEILELERLDVVAPRAPVFRQVAPTSDGLLLEWVASTSDDVVEQRIYRLRETSDSVADTDTSLATLEFWEFIGVVDGSATTMVDTSVEIGTSYRYQIMVSDEAGNDSDWSGWRAGKVSFPANAARVSALAARVGTKRDEAPALLSWRYTSPAADLDRVPYQFEVYRSTGSSYPQPYDNADPTAVGYADTDLESGIVYNYAVRVRYDNGWTGELSEIVSILIQ